MKTSLCCETAIEKRRIPFGRIGYLSVETCECEATKLTVKYANSNSVSALPASDTDDAGAP